jgi:hypothetical protein
MSIHQILQDYNSVGEYDIIVNDLKANSFEVKNLTVTNLTVNGRSDFKGAVVAESKADFKGAVTAESTLEVQGVFTADLDANVGGSVLSTGVGNIGSTGAPWGTGYISSLGDSTHPVNELYLFGDTPLSPITQYYTNTPVTGLAQGPVADTPYTILAEKIGRNVTLTFETFSAPGNNGNFNFTLPRLPTEYLPNITGALVFNSLIVQDNTGGNYTGSVTITDSGIVAITSNRTALYVGTFQSVLGASIGWYGSSVSYQSAS